MSGKNEDDFVTYDIFGNDPPIALHKRYVEMSEQEHLDHLVTLFDRLDESKKIWKFWEKEPDIADIKHEVDNHVNALIAVHDYDHCAFMTGMQKAKQLREKQQELEREIDLDER